MKMFMRTASAALFLLALATVPRPAWAANDAVDFPYLIAIDFGATEFAPGDNIVIASLRGDRPHLEIGGRYLLEGSYTLATLDSAKLGWSITTRGPSGPTPIAAGENMMVNRGSGTFRLVKTFRSDGWPHVSFYAGRSHGGVYFGEQGVESTVLRQKGWSDFSSRSGVSTAPPPLRSFNVGSSSNAGGNAAILAYLGEPVPVPADIDARYNAQGVAAAFERLSKAAGFEVRKVAVDDLEFPCLVYGIIARKYDFSDLASVNGLEGYRYAGSVVGTNADGACFFALNMTPYAQFPRGLAGAAQRRLMIRLAMLASRAQQNE